MTKLILLHAVVVLYYTHRVYSRMRDSHYFFPDHAQILTQCKTVLHPKSVKEMPETSTDPLYAVNIPVLNEKTIFFE